VRAGQHRRLLIRFPHKQQYGRERRFGWIRWFGRFRWKRRIRWVGGFGGERWERWIRWKQWVRREWRIGGFGEERWERWIRWIRWKRRIGRKRRVGRIRWVGWKRGIGRKRRVGDIISAELRFILPLLPGNMSGHTSLHLFGRGRNGVVTSAGATGSPHEMVASLPCVAADSLPFLLLSSHCSALLLPLLRHSRLYAVLPPAEHPEYGRVFLL